ncbi:YaeP family protein [Psychromonas aquatilis]|uniref:YaeP family protein n=1 Tax=Psychromonas aquatilis TaxID=2005072 RepID=A0ABU9GT55_9GAMM
MYQYSEKTRKLISQIGSGDAAYVPKAITCAINTLDEIANDATLSEKVRETAAFAAANLALSDYNDND